MATATKPKFKTFYNRRSDFALVGFKHTKPTRTQQHFLQECDINSIMRKYTVTGLLPQVAGAFFADMPDVSDFHTLQDVMIQAEEHFLMLPAEVRKRFDNNPALLFDFMEDPNNLEEAYNLGLVERPKQPTASEPVASGEPQLPPPDRQENPAENSSAG